jgi:hypothetical protein
MRLDEAGVSNHMMVLRLLSGPKKMRTEFQDIIATLRTAGTVLKISW